MWLMPWSGARCRERRLWKSVECQVVAAMGAGVADVAPTGIGRGVGAADGTTSGATPLGARASSDAASTGTSLTLPGFAEIGGTGLPPIVIASASARPVHSLG